MDLLRKRYSRYFLISASKSQNYRPPMVKQLILILILLLILINYFQFQDFTAYKSNIQVIFEQFAAKHGFDPLDPAGWYSVTLPMLLTSQVLFFIIIYVHTRIIKLFLSYRFKWLCKIMTTIL